jgi:hypothetical protein
MDTSEGLEAVTDDELVLLNQTIDWSKALFARPHRSDVTVLVDELTYFTELAGKICPVVDRRLAGYGPLFWSMPLSGALVHFCLDQCWYRLGPTVVHSQGSRSLPPDEQMSGIRYWLIGGP